MCTLWRTGATDAPAQGVVCLIGHASFAVVQHYWLAPAKDKDKVMASVTVKPTCACEQLA